MSSIFSDGALHPGRDANDAWWLMLRRPEDWGTDPRPGGEQHTRYDAGRCVLELEPLPLADVSPEPPELTAPDGTRYVLDSAHHQVLRQRRCDPVLAPLAGVGGFGRGAGCFDAPCALALDASGLLYVVDAGNHRLQVLDVGGEPSRVVVVLGAVDAWGQPLAGSGPGQLQDPVAVAVGRSRIYVACAAGVVQSYDRAFRQGPRFLAQRPGVTALRIAAAAIGEDDELLLAELGWSRLSRFDCHGRFLGELAIDDGPLALQSLHARARFQAEGTRVVGPIDGGQHGLPWHQVVVDALLPPGTRLEIQTFAADALAMPPPAVESAPPLPVFTAWAPEVPVALPGDADVRSSEMARPVLSDISGWTRANDAPYRRGASFRLTGSGPNASTTFSMPFRDARRLRAGDELELRASAAELAVIQDISTRSVSLIATGARALYGAGSELRLIEREGRARDEVPIATLGPGELIDLSSILVDGGGADVAFSHATASLVRRGDLLLLRSGPSSAKLRIDGVDTAPASILLTAAVGADYRNAALRLVTAFDRLVLEQGEGWGDGFPAGSDLDVSYIAGSQVAHVAATVVWSDAELASVWVTALPPASWFAVAPAEPPRATDRGRYLWIKLRLRGALERPSDVAAIATPQVRALKVVGPRFSYLSYLPAVFGRHDDDTPTGSLFLERYLALFEGRLTRVEARYEAVARLLNPFAADDEWLSFVASWFDLVLDPSWPRRRRAQLLSQIFELYRLRGTREGILRVVEIYTGQRPELLENFQVRPRSGLVLGQAGVLGCSPLGGLDADDATAESVLAAYAHRFTLIAHVDDDCDLDVATLALRALLEQVKPAHTQVELRLALPRARIGIASTIGVDFVVGDERRHEAPLGGASSSGAPSPILGVDAVLGGVRRPDTSSLPIGSFTLH